MGHTHPVYDTDTHFIIDPITRAVTNAESKKTLLMQNDHNSEEFSFELDKVVEGHDMTLCNQIEIHYSNVDQTKRNSSLGVYEVNNLEVTEDGNKVAFTWVVSENATLYAGSLNFLIKFMCVEDGVVTYRWNTGVNNTITIAKGLQNGEAVTENYPDILTQWKEELFAAVYGYKAISIGPIEPQTYPYIWFDTSDSDSQNVGTITVKTINGVKRAITPYIEVNSIYGLTEYIVETVSDSIADYDFRPETIGAAPEIHTHKPEDTGAIYGSKIAVALPMSGWDSNKTQTVSVPGVSEANDILVAAYPGDMQVWAEAGVLATEQTSDSVTFTCVNVPEADVTANIIILNGVVNA